MKSNGLNNDRTTKVVSTRARLRAKLAPGIAGKAGEGSAGMTQRPMPISIRQRDLPRAVWRLAAANHPLTSPEPLPNKFNIHCNTKLPLIHILA